MAVTTMDGVLAGMLPPESFLKVAATGEAVGGFHSTAFMAGRPGAMVVPTPGLAGAALTAYAGQVPFPAAVGGKNVHLSRLSASQAGNVGTLILADRLWHNSGIVVTTTTAQTVNSVAWPARDKAGATAGDGVLVGIEVSTATTNAAAISNMTMSYTNEAGTAGRTATAVFPATAVAGTFIPFALAADDKGVRSVQTLTLGTSLVAGVVRLVAYREIASVGMPVVGAETAQDPFALGLPRMYDSSVPWLLYHLASTAAGIVRGSIIYTQG